MTVSGGGLSRVFQVDAGVTASISGLTITGGNVGYSGYGTGSGGGLANFGTTTLTNCTVSGNSAYSRRRRAVQRRHGHADQLHRQRQLRHWLHRPGRRPVQRRHGHADNCTVSGNSASSRRRPVPTNYAAVSTTLTGCTISNNSSNGIGGGLFLLGKSNSDQLHRQRQHRQRHQRVACQFGGWPGLTGWRRPGSRRPDHADRLHGQR